MSDNEPQQGWLRRMIRQAIARPERGDVIAAEVGAEARGVAVGKNIVQIGTLVIPTLPLLALALVLAGGLALGAWALRGPAKMQGAFNVAVADFVELDDSGHARVSDDTRRLSGLVAQAIASQRAAYEQLNLGSSVDVWDERLPWTAKGAPIGMVANDTQALDAARRIDADVVIYGTLDAHDRLTLAFFVSPALRVYSDSVTLAGRYQFGSPLPINRAQLRERADTISARAGALFWLLTGLRHESQGSPARALEALRHANELLTSWGYGQGNGDDVLQFFIGQSALWQDRDAEAEAAFQQALAHNPANVRAQIGLGTVSFVRLSRLPREQRLDSPELAKLTAAYQRAVELAPHSDEVPWDLSMAQLALGQAEWLAGDANEARGDAPQALAHFAQALLAIEPAVAPLQAAGERRLLAQAYLTLGIAHAQSGRIQQQAGDLAASRVSYQAARAGYAGCIAQGDLARNDDLLAERVIAERCQRFDQAAAAVLAGMDGGQP